MYGMNIAALGFNETCDDVEEVCSGGSGADLINATSILAAYG